MYISELKLWNFRKYSQDGIIDVDHPHLTVPFSKGLNVLIGENDSGKTAIVDAIKLVLKTHSVEWVKLDDTDFANNCNELRIELIIKDLSDDEASKFNGKLAFDTGKFFIHLLLKATRKDDKILPYEVVTLQGGEEESLNAVQKEYLKVTYLKALRDADNELSAKKNSRLSQILLGHDTFKKGKNGATTFENLFTTANEGIKTWFKTDSEGRQIKEVVDSFIHGFISEKYGSFLDLTQPHIRSILEKLSITLADSLNLGLGTQNRLYMATELLHLKNDSTLLHSCLIEELEAHLHPQAQMKVIETLQDESNNGIQFILTTHSPNLSSKIKLNGDNTTVILCKDSDVYPLTKGKTKLDKKDYIYLDHFLDVTKSNLFFAKAVIIVEGMAEEILLPALAKNLGKSFTKSEVSIVNVGSTAYLHFARILMRDDDKQLNYPVAIVTDTDVRPDDSGNFDATKETQKKEEIINKVGESDNVQVYLATHWTLEWCLYKSTAVPESQVDQETTVVPEIANNSESDDVPETTALSDIFKYACKKAHSGTDEFTTCSRSGEFEAKLIKKLKDRSLDKVRIATIMASEIEKLSEPIKYEDNDTAKYLIKAINYVCK